MAYRDHPPPRPLWVGGQQLLKLLQGQRFAPGWAGISVSSQLWVNIISLHWFQAFCLHWPLIFLYRQNPFYALLLLVALLCFSWLTLGLAPASLNFPIWDVSWEDICNFLPTEHLIFILLIIASWFPLEELLLLRVHVVWMGWWKPAIHLTFLTSPSSKNGHVTRPKLTEIPQHPGHCVTFRNKHVSWFLFSDIRPRTFVELMGKEKCPFHWTLRCTREGWPYWDLTCEIWHVTYTCLRVKPI